MAKKLTAAEAAYNANLIALYDAPAKIIGRKAEAIARAKGDTWGAFKDAGRLGLEAGHDEATMRKGITLACAEYGVPQGSVNAYLPVLGKMYAAILGGAANPDVELALSIADARAKYQPKKDKPKAAPKAGSAQPNEGGTGDGAAVTPAQKADDSPRAALLAQVSAIIARMTDDDLSSLLEMLAEDYPEVEAPAALVATL